jgi:hypothetical protein
MSYVISFFLSIRIPLSTFLKTSDVTPKIFIPPTKHTMSVKVTRLLLSYLDPNFEDVEDDSMMLPKKFFWWNDTSEFDCAPTVWIWILLEYKLAKSNKYRLFINIMWIIQCTPIERGYELIEYRISKSKYLTYIDYLQILCGLLNI